jgi:hypothetical protein
MMQNYRLGLNNRFHPMHEDRPHPFDSKKPLLTVGSKAPPRISGNRLKAEILDRDDFIVIAIYFLV